MLPYHSHIMRRADRLFHLVQLIRGRRLSTAEFLAKRLEVSERTIYRDVADLQHQGVPIEGEAGGGYRLGAGFDLPPLMFTQEEAGALWLRCGSRRPDWTLPWPPMRKRKRRREESSRCFQRPRAPRPKACLSMRPCWNPTSRPRRPCSNCARRCSRATRCGCLTAMQKAGRAGACCGR